MFSDSLVLKIVCMLSFVVVLVNCIVLYRLLWLVSVRVYRFSWVVFLINFLGVLVLLRKLYVECVCSLVYVMDDLICFWFGGWYVLCLWDCGMFLFVLNVGILVWCGLLLSICFIFV